MMVPRFHLIAFLLCINGTRFSLRPIYNSITTGLASSSQRMKHALKHSYLRIVNHICCILNSLFRMIVHIWHAKKKNSNQLRWQRQNPGVLNQIVWMYRERSKRNFLAFSLRVSGKSRCNDHLHWVARDCPFWLLISHQHCSCRLQGFPESFQIPCSDDNDSKVTKRVSQFYRQVGNAVSPPCVAAVAQKSVEKIFSTSTSSTDSIFCHVEDVDCPVQSLLLQSCVHPDKVMAAIKRKQLLQVGSVSS